MNIDLPVEASYRESAQRLDEHVESEHMYLYLLECRRPNETVYTITHRAETLSHYDTAPSWLDIALRADHLVYVGQTDDPISRITNHVQGTEYAALFTRLFPPQSVHHLKRCDSREDALQREALLRQRLNEAFDALFAYSDLDDGEHWFGTIDDRDTSGIVG
jgi:predicted GIY-YIG superfamily endonuclease